MTTAFLILAVLGAVAVLLMDRIYHGIKYNYDQPGDHKVIRWWRDAAVFKRTRFERTGIHKSGDILYGGLGFCLFFALIAGGVSLKEAFGAALLTLAPYWIVSPFGQAYINMGSRRKADPGLYRKLKTVAGIAAAAVGVWLL